MKIYVANDNGMVQLANVYDKHIDGREGYEHLDWREFVGIQLTGEADERGFAPCIVYGSGDLSFPATCSMGLWDTMPAHMRIESPGE